MSFSRRTFVQGCAAATAAYATAPALQAMRAPRRAANAASHSEAVALRADPALVKRLALIAVDAAKSAGAAYADVRLTRTVQSSPNSDNVSLTLDREEFAVGVRCLVDGVWGFAASPLWRAEEMPILARSAVAQARANALGGTHRVDLRPVPVVTGDWSTPIEIDPFSISLEEKLDFIAGLKRYVGGYYLPRTFDENELSLQGFNVTCVRQERALATMDGTYVTQTLYRTTCSGVVGWGPESAVKLPFRNLMPAGRGWELLRDAKLVEQVPQLMAEADAILKLPVKPVDLGRYDIVCDAETMASLVSRTLGVATDLDRAMGYEANATGTSYLGPDPLSLLGTFQAGSPALTVTANRSQPGALATVKWDDEGVEPKEATLITAGILTDYQTAREQAPWLAPYYEKAGRPVQSHGYAGAESALHTTIQVRPNLSLSPNPAETSMLDLVNGVKKGLAIYSGDVTTDFQGKNGIGSGAIVREIVNGRLGPRVDGGGFLFSATELWKNLIGIGGARTAETVDVVGRAGAYYFGGGKPTDIKGQPAQGMSYSVRAVPAAFKNVAIIDRIRKA